MSNNVDDFLEGGTKVPAAFTKHSPVGATVVGTIVDRSVQQCRNFETGEGETWPDGNPKQQLVVTVQTDQRDLGDDDDGQRRIYAKKPGELFSAIVEVTHGKGHKLLPGGRLAVKFSGTKPHENPRFNDIKLYEAAYQPPVDGTDDLLAGTSNPDAPAGQPASALL
jgi:hypothetical protein